MKLRDFKNEIKVLDIAALLQKAKALKVDIGDLILDKNISKLKDLKSISKKKKELARVLTILGQKKMIASLESSGKNLESSEKTEEVKKERKGTKISPRL